MLFVTFGDKGARHFKRPGCLVAAALSPGSEPPAVAGGSARPNAEVGMMNDENEFDQRPNLISMILVIQIDPLLTCATWHPSGAADSSYLRGRHNKTKTIPFFKERK